MAWQVKSMDVAWAWHRMCELAFKEQGNLTIWITVKILAYNGIRQETFPG
jgi:hypothetical protein